MDIQTFNQTRQSLNELMSENDDFFKHFGGLDDIVYSDGAIPKKYKELTGLSISVLTRCEECIMYHIQGCIAENASKQEIIEAIKIGVIGGGSITYPSARFAFKTLKDLNVFE
ncbi:MAG: putative decarboxylase [Bacteroidetes bacterium]|nr:putative decarboxylase [Bacteroidota bacterium]